MSEIDTYWVGLSICLGIGSALLFIAVFGYLRIPPGGYVQYHLNVESTGLRVGCFLLSMGFFAAGTWTFWASPSGILLQQPASLPRYKIHGHVNDFAGILNSEIRSELNRIGDELERQRKTQIAFVTVTWLNSVPLDDLASQLTKSWGVGGKNNDREILVLISLQERGCLIRVSPGLSWDLSPAEADRLGQEMAPMMEKGNFGDALVYAAKRIQQELQNK
jgi:uncharacterized membrane protein YgcG